MVARALVALCLALGLCGPSWAYYVQLEPPSNWLPEGVSPWPGYASLVVRGASPEGDREQRLRCSGVWFPDPVSSGGGGIASGGSGGGGGISTNPWHRGCDGPAMSLGGPGTYRPIRTSSASPYDDPLLDWLWRAAPGSEAQAFVPAAVYGGALVSAALRIGGRTIFVPAFLKYAPTAGKAISKQVWKGSAVTVVSTLLAGLAGYIWDDLEHRWKKPASGSSISDGFYYWMSRDNGTEIRSSSPDAVCNLYRAYWAGQVGPVSVKLLSPTVCRLTGTQAPYSGVVWDKPIYKRVSDCPAGWYVTPAGCIQNPSTEPVPEDEFIEKTEHISWPEEIPEHMPDGLPVESPPVINPSPSPWDPAKPFFDPDGEPTRNPDFDPTKAPSPENPPWVQPGRRIRGAPTEKNPWQADVDPAKKPVQEGPDGKPKPDPEPKPDPDKPPSGGGGGGGGTTIKPSEKQPLLCEVFPSISACQPLGTAPQAQPLANKDVPVRASPAGGFGPSEGSCPEPVSISVMGQVFQIAWNPICSLAASLKPIVIALAWLTVAFAMFGMGRKGN